MKHSNHPSPNIPHHNVLDLKQLRVERQLKAQSRRPSWRPKTRGRQPDAAWNQPASQLDWRQIRREAAKFGALVLLVTIVMGVSWKVVRAGQVATQVQAQAQTGVEDLRIAASALGKLDSQTAEQHFVKAEQTFSDAREKATQLGLPSGVLKVMPFVGSRYQSGLALLEAGEAFSRAGGRVSTILDSARPMALLPSVETDGVVSGNLGFLTPLLAAGDELEPVIDDLEQGRLALQQVEARALPAAYREQFRAWQLAEASLIGDTERLRNFTDLLVGLFGQAQSQEYLVLFQNDDELRPTGGFSGTYLLVKFERGTFKILDAPVTGPFDLTAQIPKTTLPPDPILAIAPYWTFQDANWFLDVPTSNDFMLDFYEQARGFRPHGVIVVTPPLVEDLLDITGPIKPEGYGVEISNENFLRAVELQVEFGFDRALNNPKEFLLDLMPALFTKLANLPPAAGLQAVATFFQHATQSNLMITSEQDSVADTVRQLAWDGALIEAKEDYLAVVDTNLGGGKTDRVMEVSVKASVVLEAERVNHTITITRHHTGQTGDPLTGNTNRDFIRVYAPANATFGAIEGASTPLPEMFFSPAPGTKFSSDLQAVEGTVLVDHARGFRLTDESGRKVFGAWSILEPGKKQTITFTYSTPRSEGDWSLVWQKQPGAVQRDWTLAVDVQKGSIGSFTPSTGKQSKQRITWKTNSDANRTFSIDLK